MNAELPSLIKKLKKEGLTTRQIAIKIGYSLRGTYQILHRLGLHKSKRNKWTPEEEDIIFVCRSLYNGTKITNTTIEKLMQQLPNRTRSAIYNKIYCYTPPKKRESYAYTLWTPEEEAIINKYYDRSYISTKEMKQLIPKLPNRTIKAIECKLYNHTV